MKPGTPPLQPSRFLDKMRKQILKLHYSLKSWQADLSERPQ